MDSAAPLEVVERKVCEGYACGAMFFRPVPMRASGGEKLCPACRSREVREAARALRFSRHVRVLRKTA